jgi:hypothetical protein
MATELFEEVMNRASQLTSEEKRRLSALLAEQGQETSTDNGRPSSAKTAGTDPDRRDKHLAWLKAHREEYSGQYVALDGSRLMGSGPTMPDAVQQSRKNGCDNPFVVYVLSGNVIADGGL